MALFDSSADNDPMAGLPGDQASSAGEPGIEESVGVGASVGVEVSFTGLSGFVESVEVEDSAGFEVSLTGV